jgi:hypothetical protein
MQDAIQRGDLSRCRLRRASSQRTGRGTPFLNAGAGAPNEVRGGVRVVCVCVGGVPPPSHAGRLGLGMSHRLPCRLSCQLVAAGSFLRAPIPLFCLSFHRSSAHRSTATDMSSLRCRRLSRLPSLPSSFLAILSAEGHVSRHEVV